MRVVSLLPSATETLFTILDQAGDADRARVRLVGRSHECDYPPTTEVRGLPVLTASKTHFGESSAAEVDRQVREALSSGESLYHLDTDRLRDLRPDVILTQDLCRVCSIDLATVRRVAADMPAGPTTGEPVKVVSLNPTTFEGIFDDILTVAEAVGLGDAGVRACAALRDRVSRASDYVNAYVTGPRVAFLEWTEPLFVGGHWTPQLIERAGGEHPLNPTRPVEGAGAAAGPIGITQRSAGHSVTVPVEVLVATRPEVLIVCPCGLTLDQAWGETVKLSEKPWWKDLPAVRRGKVAVVDGNQMFNRPGPRLVDAYEFLVGYLNDRPGVIPAGFPWKPFAS